MVSRRSLMFLWVFCVTVRLVSTGRRSFMFLLFLVCDCDCVRLVSRRSFLFLFFSFVTACIVIRGFIILMAIYTAEILH